MVEVRTKSATRRHSQIQMRMRKLSRLVAIFTCYTKEKKSLELTVQGKPLEMERHESECQYCEKNNMKVSLEERCSTCERHKEDAEDIYWGTGT